MSDVNFEVNKEKEAIDNDKIYRLLADGVGVKFEQVASFARLYDEGASIPFIARYRKDKTGGLDDEQLRQLEKALHHERQLAERRIKVLALIAQQIDLTDEITQRVENATSLLALDEIYQPYRPKRRSLAMKARLAGLFPYAERILAGQNPKAALQDYQSPAFVIDDKGEKIEVSYKTLDEQLAGIEAIILELWGQDLGLTDSLHNLFYQNAVLVSSLIDESLEQKGEKFKDYFDHQEKLSQIMPHRLLAMLRGRQQEILNLKVASLDDDVFVQTIIAHVGAAGKDDGQIFLQNCAKRLWLDKHKLSFEHRILSEKRLDAESHAIDVFANNLKHLLMAAPLGQKIILGIDPGFKNGLKMAVIDNKGDVLATQTVYPFAGSDNAKDHANRVITELIVSHHVDFVAIGNGTASRESHALLKDLVKEHKLNVTVLVISEAGASVYSASPIAASELHDLDVSLRGAVSIARRLQDPLSELVKVEPKSIGVGQYQHDVNQAQLENSLNKVTEDCVNAVGVDVNTASAALLTHIAGLNKNVAEQIVNYRKANGTFSSREQLKRVPRLGAKTFEQAAGFLRVKDGDEPLDATGVHPESYAFVYDILAKNELSLSDVLACPEQIAKLSAPFDVLSVERNVLSELAKPAHDPRGSFYNVKFDDTVNGINDLAIGMELEGVVTNVTAFGCFVDIGVHQDGLVHISELSDNFVSNPSDVVRPSDIVRVRVIDVDATRGRIALTMKKQSKDKKDKEIKKKIISLDPQDKDNRRKKRTSYQAKQDNKAKMGSLGALLQKAGIKS